MGLLPSHLLGISSLLVEIRLGLHRFQKIGYSHRETILCELDSWL